MIQWWSLLICETNWGSSSHICWGMICSAGNSWWCQPSYIILQLIIGVVVITHVMSLWDALSSIGHAGGWWQCYLLLTTSFAFVAECQILRTVLIHQFLIFRSEIGHGSCWFPVVNQARVYYWWLNLEAVNHPNTLLPSSLLLRVSIYSSIAHLPIARFIICWNHSAVLW